MENTMKQNADRLFTEAVGRISDDMEAREIGAILWNNATAGFHYIPEVTVPGKDGSEKVIRVMGLYRYNNRLYMVEEGVADVSFTEFYTDGVEVPPVVVTLTEDSALTHLGDPTSEKGFTTEASHEEWLVIADCYFEALSEE